VALVLMSAVLLASPMTASAASGWVYWGGWQSGSLYHSLNASGRTVYSDEARYKASSNLCQVSYRFTYGNGAIRKDVGVNPTLSCSPYGGMRVNYYAWQAPVGNACVELWEKNWTRKVVTQCHYIY